MPVPVEIVYFFWTLSPMGVPKPLIERFGMEDKSGIGQVNDWGGKVISVVREFETHV